MKRPEKTEYNEYYDRYISLVDETDINAAFEKQLNEMGELFNSISEEKSMFSYAEGKWTIKEVVGHLIDGERIFGYRALRISRGDETPIEGFEQDGYVENAPFNDYKFSDLTKEFELVRRSNISFFKHLKDEDFLRTGTASGSPVSVRALAYIMVGHVSHHATILRERYL
ncbi:MAG: DinB family protein [Pyrinomonadaceae bacterium]